MPAHSTISSAYFFWDKKRPPVCLVKDEGEKNHK